MSDAPKLVLASASPSRAAVLKNAGLDFAVMPSAVDEDEIKLSLKAEGAPPGDVATTLAELKAQRVSLGQGAALVIGGDQIMTCGEVAFDKPADMDHARGHLLALRGKPHLLHTAICVAKEGAVIWRHLEVPKLTMRAFSDRFLDAYLDAAGERVLASVGAYQLEGLGAQLFDRIEGDFFSILGLPLLPLLDFLRGHGVVAR